MFFTPYKRIVCLLMILFAGTISINGLAGAYEGIFVITGNIQKIEGRIIILQDGKRLEPFHEVDIPDWAVVGARATLSYVVRPRGNCYLEIVKPGERLKVKEGLELEQRQKY